MSAQENDAGRQIHDITKRLLSLRRKGEPWAELARRLGTTPQVVNNWKSGRTVSLDVLLRVVDHAHLNVVWLLTGEGNPKAPPPETADPFAAGIVHMAERMMRTIRVTMCESVGDAGDRTDAMLREMEEHLRAAHAREKAATQPDEHAPS